MLNFKAWSCERFPKQSIKLCYKCRKSSTLRNASKIRPAKIRTKFTESKQKLFSLDERGKAKGPGSPRHVTCGWQIPLTVPSLNFLLVLRAFLASSLLFLDFFSFSLLLFSSLTSPLFSIRPLSSPGNDQSTRSNWNAIMINGSSM